MHTYLENEIQSREKTFSVASNFNLFKINCEICNNEYKSSFRELNGNVRLTNYTFHDIYICTENEVKSRDKAYLVPAYSFIFIYF